MPLGNEARPGDWNYQGPQYDPGRIKEPGYQTPPTWRDWWYGSGGGEGGNMATGEVIMNNVPDGLGPLVASVDPVSGDIVIGHSNTVPGTSAVPVTAANPSGQSNLMPLLIIGAVAFLLFKK